MDPLLQNILALAVWGSLASTLILGSFSLVQAVVDPGRRKGFVLFGAVMGYLGVLDLLRSALKLEPLTYEWLRLGWSGLYAGAVLGLLGSGMMAALGTTLGILLLGFSVFRWGNPALATTLTFPWAYGITAVAFARRYVKHRGFASSVLSAFSGAMAVMCLCYYAVLKTQHPKTIIFGYAHYAEISVISVLMGWVHLPRELRGQAPVKMHRPLATALIASVVGSEAAVMAALVYGADEPSWAAILGVLIQVSTAVGIYLYHRHQLVIYAENVGQLLEERTAALVEAKKELSRQNEILAQKLGEQAKDLQGKNRDLQAKNEVIDRQRRLELAAQTAGQVAHDIQNLISPLLSGIDELEEARSLEGIRGVTRNIRKQVGQLLDLNTNLLALARRGRVELHPVHLNQLVEEMAVRFPGQRLTLESREEVWVTGSFAQLSRAASNLIMNAFESDLDRLVPVVVRTGIVDITQNRRCHLGFLGPGRYAYLEVEDQGPGIPESLLDKIFEPFFSSKSGGHRSGSGLGLTIVSAVVDDHRGVIDLVSNPRGTRFTLFIPAIEAPTDAKDLTKLSCNATVLVVDDDSSIMNEYGRFLESAGYTVIAADSGARALKIMQAQEVDLVLLDLNMPRMSGLETFLGVMHVRPEVRAVIHSSHITEEQSVKLKGLGVSTLLLKPASRLDILRALRKAYDEKVNLQSRRDPA
jgi:signal transduction histidine kinase/ActR/RegA family two-component response regulator